MRYLACIVLFGFAGSVFAMQAIFYQPLLRDQAVSDERWEEVIADVRQQGFDTFIVQWTRFGKAFLQPEEAAWLQKRLERVRAAGFKLILGLYADPDFFQRQKQSVGYLNAYLNQIRIENYAVAREWLDRLGPEAISGWYLTTELDDANWRSDVRQQAAEKYLHHSLAELNKVAVRPVYVSSFFTGKMSPAAYRDMVARFNGTGVGVWVQTGEGTGVLSPVERQLYLDGLLPCEGVVQSIVRELFVMQHQKVQNEPEGKTVFLAAPADWQASVLKAAAPCGDDRVFFSLQYLPNMGDMR